MTKQPQQVIIDRRTDRMMYINPSLLKDSSCAFITLHIIRIPNVKKRTLIQRITPTVVIPVVRL